MCEGPRWERTWHKGKAGVPGMWRAQEESGASPTSQAELTLCMCLL